MKILKTYELFHEPIYSVVHLDGWEMSDLISTDNTLKDRIRFFDYRDYLHSNKPIYFVLFADDLIVGICKIDYFEHENTDYTICYFSIDRQYRNQKLTRLLIEGLYTWLKDNNYSLSSSSWTVPGNLKLRPLLNSMAKEFGIQFIDNDRKHDTQREYNDDLINVREMTDKEYKKFNRK
jgi:GNAT superfamily N-acetyltransferase